MSILPIQRLIVVALVLASASLLTAQQEEAGSGLKLAGLYFKLGQDAECRAALDKLLADNAANPDAQTLLAKLELKQGNHAAALKAANAALATTPDSVEATIVKARALALQGKKAEGLKVLGRVPAVELDKYEDDLEAAGLRGDTAPAKDSAGGLSVEDVLDRKLEAASAALAQKDLAKADTLTSAALQTAPSNPYAIALRAEYFSAAGKPERAVELLQKLKTKEGASRAPFSQELALGFALQDSGDTDAAWRSFDIVAGGSTYPDAERAQAREAIAALQAAKSLTEAEAALDAGRSSEAARIAETVLKTNPHHHDAKILHARAQAASGKAKEAVTALGDMKAKTPDGQKFEAQLEYAGALAADHRYREAVSAYNEVIRKPLLYNQSERDNAGEQLDDIREHHLAGFEAQVMHGSFEEGTLWRANSQLSSTRQGRTRWSAHLDWDSVELDDELYPGNITQDRFGSSLTADTLWTDHWRTFIHAGALEDAALGGVTIDYLGRNGLIVGLNADYNDPANDTLLLTAMDGRQNAISANVMLPLGKHFALDTMLIARQIEIEGTRIGNARGTETQLRWHPVALDHGLYFAYALELKDFSADESAFDRKAREFFGPGASDICGAYDAVPERINRHAFQAHGSIPLLAHVTASALAEVAWREETDQSEWGAVAELLWRISGKASLNARFEYYSGGAGPNAGEAVMLGTIGTKITW